MKYVVDEDACKNNEISISEVLFALLLNSGVNLGVLIKELKEKQWIYDTEIQGKYSMDMWYVDKVNSTLLDSDNSLPKNEEVKDLVTSLREIFPQGKKEGTNKYWRGNSKEISERLRKFYKLYGTKYDDNTIINATKKYVESFNGNYSYMRTLKYFIWKADKKVDSEGKGYVEEVSDLADYIENQGQDNINNDWMVTLK